MGILKYDYWKHVRIRIIYKLRLNDLMKFHRVPKEAPMLEALIALGEAHPYLLETIIEQLEIRAKGNARN